MEVYVCERILKVILFLKLELDYFLKLFCFLSILYLYLVNILKYAVMANLLGTVIKQSFTGFVLAHDIFYFRQLIAIYLCHIIFRLRKTRKGGYNI